MKRIVRISLCAFLLALQAGACARHKIIPDEETGADLPRRLPRERLYRQRTGGHRLAEYLRTDLRRLRLYHPRTSTTPSATSRNARAPVWATSSSWRSIMLEAEGKFYDREVAVLDTIDNVGPPEFHAHGLCRLADPRGVAARYGAPAVRRRRAARRVRTCGSNTSSTRSTGTRRGCGAWCGSNAGTAGAAASIRRRCAATGQENFTRRFHGRYHPPAAMGLDFIEFRGKPQRPSLTVERPRRSTIRPTTSAAVDSLYMQQLDIRIFADEFFRAAIPTDSL